MEDTMEQILALVKKKMREQACYGRTAYQELVEETIEYFRQKGKLTDEDNIEFIEDQLLGLWESVRDKLADNS